MVQIASKSGGNHQFVEEATELADVFQREFNDVLSVVAQQVDVEITIPEGIRPVRVLGNEADVNGQRVITRLAQIYSRQVKFVVVEVELPATEEGTKSLLAQVSTSYNNMKTQQKDVLSGSVDIKFTSSSVEVEKSLNAKVLADVVALVSSEQSKIATKFLDEGDLAKCRVALQENGAFLMSNALLCPTDVRLKELSQANLWQQKQLDGVTSNKDTAANTYRKAQRALSYGVDQQQALPSFKDPSGSEKSPPSIR
jgi:Ca-activated chloride channel family protein